MRLNELLNERVSYSHPMIIVDIQPAYQYQGGHAQDNMTVDLMNFLNNQTGTIIAYYNGSGEGFTDDTIHDVQNYFVEKGLNENKIHNIQFIEKTYGFFRAWMDQEVDSGIIINLLREMNRQRVNDSRDLNPNSDIFNQFDYETWMKDDPIYFPDINIAQLKSMSGALLCGGSKHECLQEIQLLMSVYNIRSKLARNFIYG